MSLQNKPLLLRALQDSGIGNPTAVEAFVNQLASELGNLVKSGHAALSGGSATVAATWLTAQSRIVVTGTTPVGGIGTLYIDNIVPGTSFDIKSTDNTDGRTVNWMSVEEPS